MVSKKDCYTCEYLYEPRLNAPCATCRQTVYINWKQKESPAWKEYVNQKVKEQMQTLYSAFEQVPEDCQQARFIKGQDAPKTCLLCDLGPCPKGISIKDLKL